MPLFILKNPNAQTLIAKCYAATAPAGYEPSTEEAAAEWVAAQLAAGWQPAALPEPAPAPAPVPESVGPAQLRIIMRRMFGISAAQVLQVLNALPEPDREDAFDLWEYATSIKRTHPLVTAFATAFKLTPEQVDEAFRRAIDI